MNTPRSGKTPLVLIPGLLCDVVLWHEQILDLQDCADCWVPDIARDDSLPCIVDRILKEVPFERFALAGLSMGGYLAAGVAVQSPERVTRLALLNTRAHARDSEAGKQRRQELITLARTTDFQRVVDRLMPSLLSEKAAQDPVLLSRVEAMSRNLGADVFIRQQQANMVRPDIALGLIRCPTWVIGGEEDAIAPPSSQGDLVAAISGARLHMLPGCGHLSTLEQPAEISALMRRWLRGDDECCINTA